MKRYIRRAASLFHTPDSACVKAIQQLQLRQELERLQSLPRYEDPRCLTRFGYKVFSQVDEDGIIAEIFRRIGTTNKSFVEFGCGNGRENNTVALLHQGWNGLWIDGSEALVRRILAAYGSIERLQVTHAFITRDNIDALISSHYAGEIDLLSVDIDGNDAHVLSAIKSIQPRVIVAEYNAKFHPPIDYCMRYDENHQWRGDDCFGASLSYLQRMLDERGYNLVGCGLSGANAYFVRHDLAGDRFLAPYTAEQHYEPARYYLIHLEAGHPASFQTLAKR